MNPFTYSIFFLFEIDSQDISSTETPTSRNHRKRKLNENRSSVFSDTTSGCSDAISNDRKRLALDESMCKNFEFKIILFSKKK